MTNLLIVLLDDVGFADFGCYGSEIATPTIDDIAARGTRFTNFHTTAMCSTTRAALLTGRNHHSVGVGCLANFDSGHPGYRGKIARTAGTLPEMLRPHGYRNYMIGKWHVTPLTESGPTGPFNGWPLGRGFDRFYGFLDAETDQYSPELIRDNSHITAPGTYESGYHLTEDLIDQSITMLAEHRAGAPDAPWLMWVAPGACHAPHQAPVDLIDHYTEIYAKGWDRMRDDRLARQIETGIVPEGTRLPPRNDFVQPWDDHSPDEQRLFARLGGAYAAMLHHFDQHLRRLVDFVERSGQMDDTAIVVMSDNGASQEGGPSGFVNAMGPFNLMKEDLATKIARIDDIGGPDTHSNFPWGFAMASNTPLKRYKQNTHGGGIRDPLVISWPGHAPNQLRSDFCHAADLVPTVLDRLGLDPPAAIDGVEQQPIEGTSFAAESIVHPPQYFEMFGHRGLWNGGWKAVAYHQPGTPFEDDQWELYHLDEDFSETEDLAKTEPTRLADMQTLWWAEAEAHQVLPLDDRFADRFAENVERHRAGRTRYEFWAGMGHLPSDVAPDLRSRSYTITADVVVPDDGCEGVLVAHGDLTSGYSLYVQDGHLVHDLNIGGSHQILRSDRPVPPGRHTLGFRMQRTGTDLVKHGVGTLLIDDEPVGRFETDNIFWVLISWSGLDIGLDRGTPVSHYLSPFEFTGSLERVVVELDADQRLDDDAVLEQEVRSD
jgi:arylsulfatase